MSTGRYNLQSMSANHDLSFFVLANQNIDDRIFDECSEDKDKTDGHPDVNGFSDGTGWHALHQSRTLSGNR